MNTLNKNDDYEDNIDDQEDNNDDQEENNDDKEDNNDDQEDNNDDRRKVFKWQMAPSTVLCRTPHYDDLHIT